MRPRTALLGVLTAILLVESVAPAPASPQPLPVCGACGSSFADIAEDHGVPVEVTGSTVHVQYHENGSTEWTVTNSVNASAAERFRDDGAFLDRIAGEAARSGYVLPFADDGSYVTLQSSEVDGDTVRIRFQQTAAIERHLGLLVADELHTGGVRGGWILNADTVTLVGPPGSGVLNDPTSAVDGEHAPSVEGRAVTWSGSVEDRYDNIVYADVYVVFGSDPVVGQSAGAVALASAPIVLGNLQSFVLPPTLLFAAGIAAFIRSEWRPVVDTQLAGALAVGAGVVLLTHPLLRTVVPTIAGGTELTGGAGATLLAVGLATRSETALLGPPARRAALAMVAAPLLTALLFVLPCVGRFEVATDLFFVALRRSALVLPFTAAYWFGLTTAGASLRRRLGRGLGMLALYAAALTARIPLAGDIFGAALVVYLLGTILGLLLAVPSFGLGRAVADRRDSDGGRGASGAVTASD